MYIKTTAISSLSSCIGSESVVHTWDITTNLIGKGWINCYFEPYNASTTNAELLRNCVTGSDYYVFVGALSTTISQYILLGAYAPSSVLTEFTTSTTKALLPPPYRNKNTSYNVYWYNYYSGTGPVDTKAFGFSAISNISLTTFCSSTNQFGTMNYNPCITTDKFDHTDDDRLSWSYSNGGYRAGKINPILSNVYQKVIYYKKCISTNVPTSMPINPTSKPSDDPTHNPSYTPTAAPTFTTLTPTNPPTVAPTFTTLTPTKTPSNSPSDSATSLPTKFVCADGFKVVNHQCEACHDGEAPNINQTDCVLCENNYVGLGGSCNIDCTSTDKIANELHTECIDTEKKKWYATSQFNAVIGILSLLASCSCIGGIIWKYAKKNSKLCWKKTKDISNNYHLLSDPNESVEIVYQINLNE